MNVNKVILVGRVSKDPEVKTTQSGKAVCSFSLATNSTWKDASGAKQERTEWHNVVFWGKIAEIVGQYVVKGQELYVEGRLQYRKYTGKDEVERTATDIVVEQMQMGSKPQGATPQKPENTPGHSEQRQEGLPTINIDEENSEVTINEVPF